MQWTLVLLSQKQGTSVSYFLAIYIPQMDINGCMYLFGYDTLIHLNCWLLLLCLYPIAVNYPNTFVILKNYFLIKSKLWYLLHETLISWLGDTYTFLFSSILNCPFSVSFSSPSFFFCPLHEYECRASDLSSVLIPNTSPELWHYILITEHVHIYFQLTA